MDTRTTGSYQKSPLRGKSVRCWTTQRYFAAAVKAAGMDRRNAVREKLEAGQPIYGAATGTFSPTMVEVYGELGMDYVWLDFEHAGPSPYDSRVFEDLTRAAEVAGTELLVRLPSPDPHLIRKVLDAGVRTLLIPRVETAAEVRDAVEATRFRYEGNPGERGIGKGRVSTWGTDLTKHAPREDDAVLLGVMIENRTAIENLDEILEIPELGYVFIGPSDLSVSFGKPLQKADSEVRDGIERIETLVADSNVALGGIANDPETAQEKLERGYQVLRIGDEIGIAWNVLGDRLDELP